MPHTIIQNPDGSFNKIAVRPIGIMNNIILSLELAEQSWWNDTSFGLKDRGGRKNLAETARTIADDCRRALQWLLDCGRALSIDVATSIDTTVSRNRLKLSIVAVQANGETVTFDKFIEVI